MTELKPCPFCRGGKARLLACKVTYTVIGYTVECTGCELETGMFKTADEAISYWNTRQPQGINWLPFINLSY